MHSRHEMQELVVVDGRARGIVARDLETGEVESLAADAVLLATGGYGTVYYLATYAKGATPRPSGGPTRRGRRSATPASRRSTRPASPSRATTRASSP